MASFLVHSQLKLVTRPGLRLVGEIENGTIRSGQIIRVADAERVFLVPIVAIDFVDHAGGGSEVAVQLALDDPELEEAIARLCEGGTPVDVLESSEAHRQPAPPPPSWTTFECDGRSFEYLAVPTKQKTRPADWPAHKASPGRWVPVVDVIVRRPGERTSPAMTYPANTVVTVEHAVETARRFWDELTR